MERFLKSMLGIAVALALSGCSAASVVGTTVGIGVGVGTSIASTGVSIGVGTTVRAVDLIIPDGDKCEEEAEEESADYPEDNEADACEAED